MADLEQKEVTAPARKPRRRYWIWVVGLVVLLMVLSYFNGTAPLAELTGSRFEDMVLDGDVKKVVLVKNMEAVEVTLKPEVLRSEKYRTELERVSPFGVEASG